VPSWAVGGRSHTKGELSVQPESRRAQFVKPCPSDTSSVLVGHTTEREFGSPTSGFS